MSLSRRPVQSNMTKLQSSLLLIQERLLGSLRLLLHRLLICYLLRLKVALLLRLLLLLLPMLLLGQHLLRL